jgi:hypothetical protein
MTGTIRRPLETRPRILGKQGVEIDDENFPHIFVESPKMQALPSLTVFLVYPLFQLCFRQIKQAI